MGFLGYWAPGNIFKFYSKFLISKITGLLASALRSLFAALKAAVGVISLGVLKAYMR